MDSGRCLAGADGCLKTARATAGTMSVVSGQAVTPRRPGTGPRERTITGRDAKSPLQPPNGVGGSRSACLSTCSSEAQPCAPARPRAPQGGGVGRADGDRATRHLERGEVGAGQVTNDQPRRSATLRRRTGRRGGRPRQYRMVAGQTSFRARFHTRFCHCRGRRVWHRRLCVAIVTDGGTGTWRHIRQSARRLAG